MVNYIESLYGKELLEYLKKTIKAKRSSYTAQRFLVADNEESKILRVEYNKYLEVAYRYNIIDKNLKNRLLSKEWRTFYSVHRELMCAYFIEKILGYEISFYPSGSKRYVGEFLLKNKDNDSIFIEVKAPFRETPKQSWMGNDEGVIRRNVKKHV